MKVICINDKNWKPPHCPVFGEIYTVAFTNMSPHNGKPYYYHHLEELHRDFGFRVERFAMISDIEESATLLEKQNQ